MTPTRPSRHAKPNASYFEPSCSEESQASQTESEGSLDLPAQEGSSHVQGRRRVSSKISTSKSRQALKSRITPTHDEIGRKSRKRKRSANSRAIHLPATDSLNELPPTHFINSTIPPWPTLPYQILVLIFQYASYPLCDERTFHALPSVDWLLKTSRLCKAFAEPALTVLYKSPPLVPMERAFLLRNLLVADPESLLYNYRAKVERLQIEVVQTAAYTLPGSGLLDLHGLIYHCPRLMDLELYHQKDFPPYMKLLDPVKWTYPESLFVALRSNVSGNSTKLRSWRWNSRLAGKKWPIESFLEIHQSPNFSDLRKIAFVNYQKVWVRKRVEDFEREKLLANSLEALPNLEHLIFESTTLANSTLLAILPPLPKLKQLELINCSEICSDDLAAFLLSHGSQLRALTLNYNRSLNLSFLKILGSCCQLLQSLRMNLTYYHDLGLIAVQDPEFDALLGLDETPNWPASLQILELTQLRKWDVDTAKMFFQSLLENAETLVNLRRLVIKAILSIGWRDRSSFRDEYVKAFDRVFKKQSYSPDPRFRSTGFYEGYKQDFNISYANTRDADNGDTRQSKNRRLVSNKEESKNQPCTITSQQLASDHFPGPIESRPLPIISSRPEERTSNNSNQKPPTPNIRRSSRHLAVNSEFKNHQLELQSVSSLTSGRALGENSSSREIKRKGVVRRELKSLLKTAGANAGSDCYSDSDDLPLSVRKNTVNEKRVEHIQGLCEEVSITIDNLRPTGTQFVEADFLDSEPEGDEDWDGSKELPGDGRYAW